LRFRRFTQSVVLSKRPFLHLVICGLFGLFRLIRHFIIPL